MDGPKYVLNISRFYGPKWQVKGPGGGLVGAFHTREEAEEAAKRFNAPGAKEPPIITIGPLGPPNQGPERSSPKLRPR